MQEESEKVFLKKLYCFEDTFLKMHARCPTKIRFSQSNIWSPLQRIILWQRFLHNLQILVYLFPHQFRNLSDREFIRIAEVDRACVVAFHQADQALNQIAHIKKERV